MPDYPKPAGQWLARKIGSTAQQAQAANTGSTQYLTDPTIANPSTATPNCTLIIGNVTVDNFGNSTGLPATGRSIWGLAVYDPTTKVWSQP